MNGMKSAILGIAFLLNSVSAFANEEQYLLNLTILEQGNIRYEEYRLINEHQNNDEIGDNNAYFAVECDAGRKTFFSTPVFTGYQISYSIKDGKVILHTRKTGVDDVYSQIKSMPDNQCQSISPKQTIIWQKQIEIPVAVLIDTKEVIINKDVKLLIKISKDLPSNLR
jgi:hypothetical protein